MLRSFRQRRRAKKERTSAEELTPEQVDERERLRDQQSPMKAKWGFFPK
jgi:membrane protein involved in colicin uptake